MGILIGVVVAVGAVLGAAKNEGQFKKGSDTTYKDTIAFELYAAETVRDYSSEKADDLRQRLEFEELKNPTEESLPSDDPGVVGNS